VPPGVHNSPTIGIFLRYLSAPTPQKDVDPGKRLVHTHFSAMSGAEDKPANYHRLDWRLAADGDATKLTLVQSGAHSQQEADQFKQN
jgi:hypothetical protein